MWSDKRLQIIELLLAALTKHEDDLTAISNRLQEFTQFLNNKRWNLPTEAQGSKELEDKTRLELASVKRNLAKLSHAHIKTFQTLSEDKVVTISEVANLTGRSRATASLHLRQLAELGLIERTKRGRQYYYSLIRRASSSNGFIGSTQDSSAVMILTLVSKGVLEEPSRAQSLILNNLSNLKDWKLERSVILSR